MKNRLLITVCCAFMLASTGAAAEIYKWKDAKGKMQYSDTPPMSNIPYTTLSGKKPVNAPVQSNVPEAGKPVEPSGAPVASTPPTKPATGGEAVKPGAKPEESKPAPDAKAGDAAAQKKALEEKAAKETELKKLQDEKLAAEKQAKCKNAKSRLAQFQQGGRIYRVNEKGEREYYGDKEIAGELEQAKSDVEASCD
jgi:hypothetical protein